MGNCNKHGAHFQYYIINAQQKNVNISGGWKMIKGRGNYCVGYVGGNSYIRNRRCNVQWRFIRYGGNYIIQNRSGKVLRIYSIYIYSWPRQNNTPQRWYVHKAAGGRFIIKNHSSRKCLYCAGYTSYNYHYNHYNCNKNNAHFQYYIKAAKKIKNANIPGGWKMIKGRGNLCLGYVGRHTYVRNRRCNGASNVQWRFIKYAGRYIIQNRSGYVLRIYGGYVKAWTRQNNTPQRWLVESIGGGKYMIRNQNSHKCLYCAGYTSYNYHYTNYNCNKNNAHFQYYIVNVRKVKNANIPSGWKMIKTRGRYCLGYVGRHTYVRNRNCNGANNVQWRFIKYGGRYIIQNRSGYVLRIYSSYIKAWTRQNNTPQRFLMDSIGGGRYLIKNQNSHKCIQNNSYNSYNYHYNQYNCNIKDARQQYYIKDVRKIKNANIPSGWKMIKGRGNLCLAYKGRHTYVRQAKCDSSSKVQ